MTFSPCFLWFVLMARFPLTQEPRSSFFRPIVVGKTENRQVAKKFISAAESAPAGIAAPVPVGSVPELSHKKIEPQPSCRACGTYLHGRNAQGNNLPIR